MTNHGDDCFFYYYSTCTKGDSCLFRHCEAALGNETVCNLWQEGRCFRQVCKFRHMEKTKNRKEIRCYWESQPAGCQKPFCAFFHEKPRCVDGVLVLPDKGVNLPPEEQQQQQQLHEDPPPAPIPAPLPAAANPQLRGVIKAEAQEPVPSPTHPPVVINPADDDEDEDDQYSEGEDSKGGPSPRKIHKSGDFLNFGVSSLEEIRLRKALKASMKRAGYPIQSPHTSDNLEKENIQAFFRPALYGARDVDPAAFEDGDKPRGSVADRLGRRIPDIKGREGLSLKRSLAERLGGVVEEEEPSVPPLKSLKPVRERLGLSHGTVAPTPPEIPETNTEWRKAPEQIRIKTLEEIRLEKAAKSQSRSQKEGPEMNRTKAVSPKTNNNNKSVRQAITTTTKDNPKSHVKTFSEILHAKKRGQRETAARPVDKAAARPADKAAAHSEPAPEEGIVGGVKVKTLEEIRREKAARLQAEQPQENDQKKGCDTEHSSAKKPRLLRTNKPAAQPGSVPTEQRADVTEKPLKSHISTPEASAANGKSVKVKTFEEIMQEKRNRRQEMEEQAKSQAQAEPAEKQDSLKRKAPARITFSTAGSSPRSSDSAPSAPKLPVRKAVTLSSRAARPVVSSTATAPKGAVLTSVPGPKGSSPPAAEATQLPDRSTEGSSSLSPAKPSRAAPTADQTLNNNHKKTAEHSTDTKVRPKLNVKPSVMKPAVQLKPGQRRRGAERSAVAAVKPLNSTPTGPQDNTCSHTQVLVSSSAEAAPPSPLRDELQTVPVFTHSLSQGTKPAAAAAATEPCVVPQSPVLKPAVQPKSRRPSAAASRSAVSSSAVDDFEELINEFTEDQLEDDLDPGIGEDDLLQELSEMIDS